MKKMLCFLLLLGLILSLAGCGQIYYRENAKAKVVYHCNDISFEEELTQEELSAVLSVLNGKVAKRSLAGSPGCGFYRDVAIIINDTRYSLACDKCGTIKIYGTMKYIHITDGERAVLEEIFTSRGGKFPCI